MRGTHAAGPGQPRETRQPCTRAPQPMTLACEAYPLLEKLYAFESELGCRGCGPSMLSRDESPGRRRRTLTLVSLDRLTDTYV
jgi:hypothetical protein